MSDATTHSPSDNRIALPFLVFSTLLLAFLIPVVIYRKPIMDPDVRRDWVMHHQAASNFILARKFVVARLDSPTTLWLPDFQCGEAGRGVWYAQGGVKTTAQYETPIPWRVLFIPGESAPLYLQVGSHEEGDFSAALVRAGRPWVKP